jgi:eukaryotic-like serine/threonine-protein kinase
VRSVDGQLAITCNGADEHLRLNGAPSSGSLRALTKMANLPPKLGPFEPLYRLGAGGMAETFVAVRRGPGGFEQRVCIKRILPAYEDDQEFVRSFVQEARTSAALRHGNIVQVLDFAQLEEDASHYLVLELIDGLDLRALLQRGVQFDADLVVLIASELAAALEHAHELSAGRDAVVHRDISPSNVLISQAGEVKLTDFGIARVLGGEHRTASGTIKGKVPYMPPEYITAGQFDARGDLFALGVLLFELAHGERPFDGDSELDTLRKIAAGERLAYRAPAPQELIDCVTRLLAVRREDRFESARDLLDALPSIPVNRARRRLAELVKSRLSALPGRPSSAAPAAPSPRTLPLDEQLSALPVTPTTPPAVLRQPAAVLRQTRPRALLPSRRALLSLVAATALLLAVGLMALVRTQLVRRAGASSVPPRLPLVPAAYQVPSPTRATPSANVAEGPPSIATPQVIPSERIADAHSTTQSSKPSRPSEPAELRVVVYPYGEVWVDDKYVGQSPLTVKLTAGSHALAVGEGRVRERKTIQLSSGQHESVVFRLPPPNAR